MQFDFGNSWKKSWSLKKSESFSLVNIHCSRLEIMVECMAFRQQSSLFFTRFKTVHSKVELKRFFRSRQFWFYSFELQRKNYLSFMWMAKWMSASRWQWSSSNKLNLESSFYFRQWFMTLHSSCVCFFPFHRKLALFSFKPCCSNA